MTHWRRIYGRRDYVGWKLYVRGTNARAYVGHSLPSALFWISAYRLRRMLGLPPMLVGPLGHVLEMRLIRPGEPTPRV
jgi:hypothetical protein